MVTMILLYRKGRFESATLATWDLMICELPSSELPITSTTDTAGDLYNRSGYDPKSALLHDAGSGKDLRDVRATRRAVRLTTTSAFRNPSGLEIIVATTQPS